MISISTLFISSLCTVKIWDLILGAHGRILFTILPEQDIKDACLDDRRRKFFVGTAEGRMSCHNYANGALMKKFSKINGRVIAMRYDHGRKAVICASLQGRIIIYDEKDIESTVILSEPSTSPTSTARSYLMLYSMRGRRAVRHDHAAESVEGIRFWASDQASIDSQLCTRGQVILNMGFLEPYPLLWVATSDGRIRIWGCPTRNEKTGKLDDESERVLFVIFRE